MQNLIKFHKFFHKILSRNKVLMLTKGHNSVKNLQNWMCNNPNLDLIMVNAYAKLINLFGLRFYGPVNPMGSFERSQFT